MGLCNGTDRTHNNIWFRSGDIPEDDSDNSASGVCHDKNLIISRFRIEAYEEEDVDYYNEEAGGNIRDSGTQQIRKTPPLHPSLVQISQSEPLFGIRRGRQSLLAKITERSSDPFHDEFAGQKRHAASLYVHALEKSTSIELSATYRNAESLLEKGNEIHEELRRQGNIVKQANRDIESTEKDICDTSHTLKGMKSLKSNFKNTIWLKPGSPQVIVLDESDDECSYVRQCSNLPPRFPSYHDKVTKQGLINERVDRLWHVLDEVEHTQKDIGKELGKQEKNLQSLDHNIDHIDHKIHNQTKIMRNIRKK